MSEQIVRELLKDVPGPLSADLKLFRRIDGTFALSNAACQPADMYDDWCTPALSRTILGTLIGAIVAFAVFGIATGGWKYIATCLAGAALAGGFSLGVFIVPAVLLPLLAVTAKQRPENWHPCHWLSLTPTLVTVFTIVWSAHWANALPQDRADCWQNATPAWFFLANVLFSVFLLSVYKEHWKFFTVLVACQLWYGFFVMFVAGMAISDVWI